MGVTYLLDTHVLIWVLGGTGRPSARTREALDDPATRVVVSAVTALELATKVRLGKFPGAADLVENWDRRLAQLGVGQIPILPEHALRAGLLDWSHRDPFDRLLVAQARVEGFTLVTADGTVAAAPGVTVLPW